LLRKLSQKPEPRAKANLKPVPTEPGTETVVEKPAAPRKTASKSTAKKATGRRAGTADLRSTN
jgi:hypothetical protein